MANVTRQTYDEVMMPVYKPLEMVIERGEGVYLYDTHGNKYLDLAAGIAVNCLGHNNPGIVKIISEQAQKLIHVSNIFTNTKTLELALKITHLTGFDKVFFVNSGTEANEAALKLARRYAYEKYGEQKDEIISFTHSFHGRTFFSVSVGGQPKYSKGFGPKPGAITHLPFNDIKAFEKQISDKTCAVILEPVQGEGGVIKADSEFLSAVRNLCDKHNAILIFDEVQTGLARSGTLYAYEQMGVRPDILTTSKALAGGIPCGALLTSTQIATHFSLGSHGSTFGGNPLACAVACYVLDVISDKNFLQAVQEKSKHFFTGLNALKDKYKIFKEVRGMGLLIGAVLSDEYQGKASLLQELCGKENLLVLTASPDVLRLTPPLIISDKQIDIALELLDKACNNFIQACK